MPATHDYSGANRGWGHDYTFEPVDGGQRAVAKGWGRGLNEGDYLILDHPDGGTTRYGIASISYYTEPSDMWRADLVFDPRLAEAGEMSTSDGLGS
jgi:hypothetical protein